MRCQLAADKTYRLQQAEASQKCECWPRDYSATLVILVSTGTRAMRVATGGHWGARPPLLQLVPPPDENSADGITCLRSIV